MEQSPKSKHIVWDTGQVTRAQREAARGHRGATIWLTGFSGSGKSTLARALESALAARGVSAYVLDGDNVRHGLCSDLGFSPEERHENIRRVGEVAKLFVDAGVLVLCAFVSPYRSDRARVRAMMQPGDFIETHVAASLETCLGRDPKGLYAKAKAGEISNMTGVAAPYEPPEQPELVLDTELHSAEQLVEHALGYLAQHGYIRAAGAERSAP